MTLSELLTTLNQSGVHLSLAPNGKLMAVAKAGILTPEIKSALAEHRNAILATVTEPPVYKPDPGFPSS